MEDFPVYWPLKGHTFVFFSFIQGLAIKNTTGKYFIAVPLTGLSLLTCKSFIWMLSGPYSCYHLTASALTQAPWPCPPCDNMRVCDRAAASGVTGFLEARRVVLVNHVGSSQSDLNTPLIKDIKVMAAWAATGSTNHKAAWIKEYVNSNG